MIELLIRVVVDTNIWISALINPVGPPARLIQAFRDGRAQLVLSEQLLDELHEVAQRPRIRRRIPFDDQELAELLRTARDRAIIVIVSGNLLLCRDPKDDVVIETARVGQARYVVSRDEDLTRDPNLVDTLRGFGIDVLTVARFLALLDAQTS